MYIAAVTSVLYDEYLHGHALFEAGRQFLAVHREGAVAVDVDHELARVARLDAHGRGQAIAHGAQASRRAPPARVLEPVVLRRPHLVLAHAGDHQGLAVGQVGDLLHHVLRLDDVVAPLVAERLVALPLRDLVRPLAPRFLDGALRVGLRLLANRLHELGEHALAVAYDRDADLDVLRDGRRVDVDVDDLGVGGEGVHAPGDAVIE